MILNKRVPREFKENLIKYIGLMFLVIISSMAVVALVNASDSIIKTGKKTASITNLEDGNFEVDSQLDNFTIQKIKDKGVTLDENFYIDYEINNTQKLRLFKYRSNLNKISLIDGTLPSSNETSYIIIDQHFGETNNYSINNYLLIDNSSYKIIGYGAVSDYSFVVEKTSDVLADSEKFGIGFISASDFDRINLKKTYCYSFKLNGFSADKLKNIVNNNATLTSFLKASDNPRIKSYIEDSTINKNIATCVGTVLFIMIAFIISMSLVNNIDEESSIIGALYSLGYVKREILNHYMMLPIVLVSSGSFIGTLLGLFVMQDNLQKASTDNYSLPIIQKSYSPSLLFIGLILPVLITFVVNYKILSKRLNSTPLQLLRKEKKQSNFNVIKINHFSFITKFKITHFLREMRGTITLFLGISISVFLLVYGLSINGAIYDYINNIENDTKFNYMYTLTLPINIAESSDVEKITLKGLVMYYAPLQQNMDVSLEGISEDTNFYNFNIKDDDDGVYIADTTSKKFNLNVGDYINLKDTSENKVYNLKVSGIVHYSSGLYAFMNKKQLNKLLDESDSYFNGYLSNEKLNINDDYIYSLTTKANIVNAGKSLLSTMSPIIVMVIIISTILFIINMFLLLKLIIDKNTFSISLIKVLGYNDSEINDLYLGSSFYTIVASALISTPISIIIINLIWPQITSNYQAYFPIVLTYKHYIFMVIIILGSYFVSNSMLKRHLNKIPLAEALKNRD